VFFVGLPQSGTNVFSANNQLAKAIWSF